LKSLGPEPPPSPTPKKRVLIAGIGNRLRGDDGFGPRVVEELARVGLPRGVELRDLGLARVTLAQDLEGFDMVVLVDAVQGEGEPGEVWVEALGVEGEEDPAQLSRLSLHEVGLEGFLLFAKALGVLPPRIVLVGCVPGDLSPRLGLSGPVEAAVSQAVALVKKKVEEFLLSGSG